MSRKVFVEVDLLERALAAYSEKPEAAGDAALIDALRSDIAAARRAR